MFQIRLESVFYPCFIRVQSVAINRIRTILHDTVNMAVRLTPLLALRVSVNRRTHNGQYTTAP